MKDSELSWNLQDYLDRNQEAPDRVISNPYSNEGEMMTQEEIEQYCIDSLKTIRVLTDHGDGHADKVIENYLIDLRYLQSIGRIDEDAYNELSNKQNFYF